MSHKANELVVANMNDWLQPETLEKLARVVPSVLSSISKLKQSLSKGGGPKRDLKKICGEIDDLRKDLGTVCDLMTKHCSSNTKLAEAILRFQPLFTPEKIAALSSWCSGVNIGVKAICEVA